MASTILRYEPFGDIVDDFLKGFLVKPLGYETAGAVRRMRLDVSERDGEYKVHAELPGVRKDDINVQVEGDQVTLSAEVRNGQETKDGDRVLHRERYFGKLSRVFRLGEEIDDEKVVAKFADGILELRLPKKAAGAARRITVQ